MAKDIVKTYNIGDFIRLWHPDERLWTIGIYKGHSGKEKVLIEETRIVRLDGTKLLFKRVQYWRVKDIENYIARIDV
jgi:hypothetical protein